MSRITVGALVRHRVSGRLGIVIEQARVGGDDIFRVKWSKVYTPSHLFSTTFLDYADRWVLINGCDIP